MSLLTQPWRNSCRVRLRVQYCVQRWSQPTRLCRLHDRPPKTTLYELRTDPNTGSMRVSKDVPPSRRPSILNPYLFGFVTCFMAYVLADTFSITSDHIAHRALSFLNQHGKETIERLRPGREREAVIRRVDQEVWKQISMRWLRDHGLGSIGGLYGRWKEWWIGLDDGKRATAILIGLNAVPFLMWQRKSVGMQAFLHRSFTHSELSGRGYTLLTSVFSHKSPLHFLFNMYALWCFGPATFNYLDARRRELDLEEYPPEGPWNQRFKPLYSTYHNIAFFTSAGVLANFVPHCARLLIAKARTGLRISQLTPQACQAAGVRFNSSLGASGAIYALLAVWTMAYPERKIGLVLLPGPGLEAMYAFPALLVCFDVGGLVFRWTNFDHLAHLTGAAVGALAYKYEPALRHDMLAERSRKAWDRREERARRRFNE